VAFSTNFDGTENPLSEGGVWINNGLDWTKCQKANGYAFGTQSGVGGYDDSYAYLRGFSRNVQLSAVVRIPNPNVIGTHEVELHARWIDGPHVAQGYEISLNLSGDVQIIRWNGPFGDFTLIGTVGNYPGLKDGDVFSATALENVITGYVNGVPLAQAIDDTFPSGNPGIGFFRRAQGNNSDFGFNSFTAESLTGA